MTLNGCHTLRSALGWFFLPSLKPVGSSVPYLCLGLYRFTADTLLYYYYYYYFIGDYRKVAYRPVHFLSSYYSCVIWSRRTNNRAARSRKLGASPTWVGVLRQSTTSLVMLDWSYRSAPTPTDRQTDRQTETANESSAQYTFSSSATLRETINVGPCPIHELVDSPSYIIPFGPAAGAESTIAHNNISCAPAMLREAGIQDGPKIGTILLYALTLPNINRFSKLFHSQNQEKIYHNTITKDPTIPEVCRYTTLWNVKCLKSNNWKQDDFCEYFKKFTTGKNAFIHQIFSVSALLLDDAPKPATPLTTGVINETLLHFTFTRYR